DISGRPIQARVDGAQLTWGSVGRWLRRILGMRLKDKVAIVVGAGQTPGDTIGNGRAASILFAREGARVVLVDHNHESALQTQAMIEADGGACFSIQADV